MTVTELARIPVAVHGVRRGSGQNTKIAHLGIRSTRSRLINWFEIANARRGIMPGIGNITASRYHGMSREDLWNFARDLGLVQYADSTLRKDDLIELLLQAEDTAGEEATEKDLEIWKELNPTDSAASGMILTTHNRGIFAHADPFGRLENAISVGFRPNTTMNNGLLCGPRALVNSVNDTRAMIDEVANPDRSGPLERIQLNAVLSRMFTNFDPAAAEYRPANTMANLAGTATAEYDTFLRNRPQHFGLNPSDETYNDQMQHMTSLNNITIDQMAMMLAFMHHAGFIEQEYALGVVTAGEPAAHVHIYGNDDLNIPLVWVYNDGEESRDYLGHWEGFEQGGDGLATVMAWGFNLLEAADISAGKADPRRGTDMAEEERMKRERARARAKLMKQKNDCISCQLSGRSDCDGVFANKGASAPWKPKSARPCTPCADDGIPCHYPSHVTPMGKFHTGNKTMADPSLSEAWRDKSLDPTSDCGTELPTPETPFFQVFLHIRCSSNPGPVVLALLNQLFPIMAMRYNNLLNANGTRPGGPGTFMLWQPVLLCRHGNKQAPSQHGNMVDQTLHGFVTRVHELASPPLPGHTSAIRIQHVTMGLAGFTVGVTGYGNRLHGLINFWLSRTIMYGIPLASITDIVSVVEELVVNGGPDSLDPGVQSPNWQLDHGKYVQSNPLLDLSDRYTQNAFNKYMFDTFNTPIPPATALQTRLDRHIWALQWEHEWRASHLGVGTVPTDHNLHNRNFQRNRNWV
ncbi:hypothetical protein LTR15_000413 [Elasticomyces elasticus]|nr:hypothetical protein LTR15_000413 [Elasticomyces elasticus]